MASSSLTQYRGRKRGAMAFMKTIAGHLDCTVAAEAANEHPRWLSRQQLHEKIFRLIAEQRSQLEKDSTQ